MEEVSFVSKLCMYICAQLLSSVWLFSTPWAVACQAPLSMGYSRQEYWSGLPFPSPGDLPDPFPHPSLHINVCSFDFSSEYLSGSLLLNKIKNLCICMKVIILPPFESYLYLWLCWVFIAFVRAFSTCGEWGYSLLWCTGFSLLWLLSLRNTGSRVYGL